MISTMKKERYLLVCLGTRDGMFYYKDKETGSRKSLKTRDPEQAELLVQHKNLVPQNPLMNRQIGMAYLSGSDPALVERVWQDVMDDIMKDKTGSTLRRWETAAKDTAFDRIRNRVVVTTQAADLKAVLRKGTISTNVYLRRLQNHCIDMGWLAARILPKKQFPKIKHKEQRAITWREHSRIVAREPNPERRDFYELCWYFGGSQSDMVQRDSVGRPVRLLGINWDISDRKLAEAENSRTAAIIRSAQDAIIGTSLTGQVLSWNEAAERIYGYSAVEMQGRNISILVPVDRGIELAQFQQQIELGLSFRGNS